MPCKYFQQFSIVGGGLGKTVRVCRGQESARIFSDALGQAACMVPARF